MNDSKFQSFHLIEAPSDVLKLEQWDFISDLRYKQNEVPSSCNTLSFDVYADGWFKDWIKLTFWKKRNLVTASTLVAYNKTIKSFYRFAITLGRLEQPTDLTRALLIKYMESLRDKANATQKAYFAIMRELTICWQEWGWLPSSAPLFFRDDAPRNVPTKKPRALSSYIQTQIAHAILKDNSYMSRLISIYLEVGARGLEVLRLPYECIHKDSDGWYLTRNNLKYRNEHVVPISNELAAVIIEQQKHVDALKKCHGNLTVENDYLFLHFNQVRKLLTGYSLRNINTQLHNFCEKYEIKTESGLIVHISSHQFRHTVGTNLINNGVSQHYVAKFLGHASPSMTAVYARIHDSTLRKAVQGAVTSFVDINGTRYKPDKVLKDIDLHSELTNCLDAMWLRKQIGAQTLPNGLCSLPVTQSCDHANACLACPNFRTDKSHIATHQQQLERTVALISCAHKAGYVRQAELNSRVKLNLEKIIEALEIE